MIRPEIQNYSFPHQYLQAWFEFLRADNRVLSLREWAKVLGFNNPGYLSNVLRGKRTLTPKLIERLTDMCGLSQKEATQLLLLANRNIKQQFNYQQFFGSAKGGSSLMELSFDKFRVIRDWYHLPLLQLVETKNFNEDYVKIAKCLGHRVGPIEIELAVARLLRLKLLKRDAKGRLRKGEDPSIIIGNNTPSSDIQAFHRKFLEIGLVELNEQSLETRDYSSVSLPIEKEKLPQLRELIKEFHQKLLQLSDEGEPDSVYQINLQCFELFLPKKEK
ncbi:MAG: TIGR02147 family protein [Oligoflexales bacterium]|nr:TIGR02147 family protein [Oligoflexales bacterium]